MVATGKPHGQHDRTAVVASPWATSEAVKHSKTHHPHPTTCRKRPPAIRSTHFSQEV
jgi:hypothetical protein